MEKSDILVGVPVVAKVDFNLGGNVLISAGSTGRFFSQTPEGFELAWTYPESIRGAVTRHGFGDLDCLAFAATAAQEPEVVEKFESLFFGTLDKGDFWGYLMYDGKLCDVVGYGFENREIILRVVAENHQDRCPHCHEPIPTKFHINLSSPIARLLKPVPTIGLRSDALEPYQLRGK